MLIGLVGASGSGKDTIAGFLATIGWERIAFADQLKAAAYDTNPIVLIRDGFPIRLQRVVDDEGWDAAKQRPEVRRYLQEFGVAVRDHVSTTAWVSAALDQYEYGQRPTIVTDVRFQNEVDAIHYFGGKVVRVVRAGLEPVNDHVSESGLPDLPVDFTFLNDGSLDTLRVKTAFLPARLGM